MDTAGIFRPTRERSGYRLVRRMDTAGIFRPTRERSDYRLVRRMDTANISAPLGRRRGWSAAWDTVGAPLPCRGGAGVGSLTKPFYANLCFCAHLIPAKSLLPLTRAHI